MTHHAQTKHSTQSYINNKVHNTHNEYKTKKVRSRTKATEFNFLGFIYTFLPSVKEEISRSSLRYYKRHTTHPNDQVLALMAIPGTRRLRRHAPNDLPGRFMFTV
jgi:hypothetical protein